MGQLTTHVLDTYHGIPAEGVEIELTRLGSRARGQGAYERPGPMRRAAAHRQRAGRRPIRARFPPGRLFPGARREARRPPLPLHRRDPHRHRGRRSALSRAAARHAVELLDLPRQLMAAKEKTEHRWPRFVLDGNVVEARGVSATTTLLQYLRGPLGRCGTKEGCAEGDCGACTVVVGEPRDGRMRYSAINSCIRFAPTLDGKEVVTVESLRAPDATLHPVQQAMVEAHASQ